MMKKLDSVVAFYVIVPQHQSCHMEHGLTIQAEDYTQREGRRFFSQKTQETKASNTASTLSTCKCSDIIKHSITEASHLRKKCTLI
jgi:hypothetical protein